MKVVLFFLVLLLPVGILEARAFFQDDIVVKCDEGTFNVRPSGPISSMHIYKEDGNRLWWLWLDNWSSGVTLCHNPRISE
ncbi:MAG: hypothetical protein US71_C0007G0012 [Parcubacteria group bacterium GW2011_GWD2_38_12]|nr:MAG: hypothetical protein US06_C0008G0034 [Parcubacteria group bacterium GW2011_GWC2_36_17]KKQ39459.1 MAG: hypothetical protein US56_C0017G0007 [Candidatus Moranbacteria bacterium GW2011_GWF2_37_7]KKQ42448.1 MAG: hypothetical protein US61_C0026G0022 [Parcubacteria group bacterium GW2011_GWE2_37_8]KKQ51878.1 MAG: hypothetical protein US71_C0007G0012 [Parcubacteria group bacterium GW2011_GWD2_38_12]KKQ58658.1 MAG: hypothetical protein US79_C0004G0023 [Parcubacteria group bacterium GW2011_GWC1_